MLVICALTLVVVAAAYLVMGLAGGDIGQLYVSMVLCAGSLVVLAVSARVSRARPAPGADEPLPLVDDVEDDEDEEREDASLVLAGARVEGGAGADDRRAWADGEAASLWAATAGDEPAAEVRPDTPTDRAPAVAGAAVATAVAPVGADDPDFPIVDYDALEVVQVLDLVPELYEEELPVVAAHERATKARPAVLDALAAAAGDPSLAFPIAEYGVLEVPQIVPLLDHLDTEDLEVVRAAERGGAGRAGVLVAVTEELARR